MILNNRPEAPSAGMSAMVFRRRPQSGEHSIVTRDLDVGPMSVLQFDVRFSAHVSLKLINQSLIAYWLCLNQLHDSQMATVSLTFVTNFVNDYSL